MIIEVEGDIIHGYHPKTGEALEPAQTVLHPHQQDKPGVAMLVEHYLHDGQLSMWGTPLNTVGQFYGLSHKRDG